MPFRPALIAFSLFAAASATAEPAPGTVLVYDTMTAVMGDTPDRDEMRLTLLRAPEGLNAFSECRGPTFCMLSLRRGLFQYVRAAYPEAGSFDPSLTYGTDTFDDMEMLQKITVSEQTGGSIFPLVDGKRVTWTETWASDDFNAVYHMSVEQSCCVPADNPLAHSDEVWTLKYTFEEVQSDRVAGGDFTFFYDPELGWWTGSKSVNRSAPSKDDPLRTILIEHRLKAIEAPE
ncbi:hypothetical protein [Mameliella alba]|uniref:Uncharacterized protein n=1 Tax=Mameliella alba TaxID=561184 RepID=A0A0B3SPJ4_9RHOB|nr:hypothetical protein [Mameliella alba]KHQ52354.1 hypothetical protein OA50_03372 [Mameliella alba]